VQVFDCATVGCPDAVLLHGTGASTHSWRDVAPALSSQFRVISLDLPGHGFTDLPSADALSLPGMGAAVSALLSVMGISPTLLAGHSAGAAVAAWIASSGRLSVPQLVGINGAWLPFGGPAAPWLSPATRWLAQSPGAARLFSTLAASPLVLDRLLAGTGSAIDAAGRRGYATLVGSPGHVSAALGMMARWDLRELVPTLARQMAQSSTRLQLIVGSRDLTVAPSQSAQLARQVPGTRLDWLPGLGHLAHEEAPQEVAALIASVTRSG
jgi:magnesium chelatase accessory protein